MWTIAGSLLLLTFTPYVLGQARTCSAITPSPSHYVCNSLGYANFTAGYYTPTSNQTVNELAECRNLCLNRAFDTGGERPEKESGTFGTCQTFSHDASTNLCALYPYPLREKQPSQSFVADAHSTSLFFNKHCFRCKDDCDNEDPLANLVDNPGFELSSDSLGPWAPNFGGNWTVTAPGHHSAHAGYIYSYYGDEAYLSQTFRTCLNKTYIWSFDVKAADIYPGQKVYESTLRYDTSADGDLYNFLSFKEPGNGTWQTITNSFLADIQYGSGPLIFVFTPGSHSFYLDNVSVRPASTIYTTKGNNLLINGGFETGLLTPWVLSEVTSANLTIVSPGLGGSAYAVEGLFSKSFSSGFYFEQTFAVPKPGAAHLISFDFVTTLAQNIITVYMRTPGSVYDFASWSTVSYTANQTETFQRIFTPRGPKQSLTIEIDTFGAAPPTVLYMDNFVVKEVSL